MNHKRLTNYNRGQMMIIAIIFLTVFLILSTGIFSRVTSFIAFGFNTILKEQAISVAEAGIDYAVWQLNQTAGGYTGSTDVAVGSTGTFNVAITNKTSSLKTITATAYVPNSTKPRAKRIIKVDVSINNTIIAFNYAVQIGTGGVTMGDSTINGTVYSNKTGVSIQGSGTALIKGDAYAAGSITSPRPTVTGSQYTNASPVPLPTVDYQYWKTQANGSNDPATCPAGSCTTCTPTCNITTTTIGPQKYVGNVSFSNSAPITMNGPVYVTGNVSLFQSARITLNNSFGSNGTVFIADGTFSIIDNALLLPTSANPKGYIMVVTTSTSNQGITVGNQGVSAIFYALDGGVDIQNNTQVTALVAKQLTMSNNGSLTYDQGLANASFSGGPGGSWQIKKGTYRFTNSP